MFKCKFRDCTHTAESQDPDKCIFHAGPDKKGIPNHDFNYQIYRLISGGHFNFVGFIFPDEINFEGKNKLISADFSYATFEKQANFRNVIFDNGVKFGYSTFKELADFTNASFFSTNEIIFRSCKFDGIAEFIGSNFQGNANFIGSVFNQNADFSNTKFKRDCDFSYAKFKGDTTNFMDSTFESGDVFFRKCEFLSNHNEFYNINSSNNLISFNNSVFRGQLLNFSNSTLNSEYIDFQDVKFQSSRTEFRHVIFANKLTSFINAKFESSNTNFYSCKFSKEVSFRDITVDKIIEFRNIELIDNCKFTLTKAEKINPDSISIIKFININFNPYETIFQEIGSIDSGISLKEQPILLFRYCYLRDVSFSNCNLSLFSFYKSHYFEDALFVSNDYYNIPSKYLKRISKYYRKNVIFEDLYFNKYFDSKLTKEQLELNDLSNYKQISKIYTYLKRAADQAKDYHDGSWFYFNEFEMKSLHFKNNKEYLKYLMYKFYFCFFGYGEKPIYSFLWFIPSFIFFSIFHMLNGIQIVNGTGDVISFNYKFSISYQGFHNLINTDFWSDFATSCSFNLSRIIPSAYKIYSDNVLMTQTDTFCDHLLSFSNTVVLVSLLIFIGIGLKRHFRRF